MNKNDISFTFLRIEPEEVTIAPQRYSLYIYGIPVLLQYGARMMTPCKLHQSVSQSLLPTAISLMLRSKAQTYAFRFLKATEHERANYRIHAMKEYIFGR